MNITIKQEPGVWQQQQQQNNLVSTQSNDINDYLTRQGISINLQQFLKFDNTNTNTVHIKRDPGDLDENESIITDNNNQSITQDSQQQSQQQHHQQQQQQQTNKSDEISMPPSVPNEPHVVEVDANGKVKKKRKYKKKPPKPKPPKPGQVHIATALDGTILFCCPECQLAYPEKTDLEQHLTVHKIERRYICDICGAGLKRKEHLERHKLGHSPERPHICSVCMKGFKRKEHLNLHFVIHSGDKTEVKHYLYANKKKEAKK